MVISNLKIKYYMYGVGETECAVAISYLFHPEYINRATHCLLVYDAPRACHSINRTDLTQNWT